MNKRKEWRNQVNINYLIIKIIPRWGIMRNNNIFGYILDGVYRLNIGASMAHV